jgi:hypothetical protein
MKVDTKKGNLGEKGACARGRVACGATGGAGGGSGTPEPTHVRLSPTRVRRWSQ